jgi:two-component system, OmpR family, sensor kinase
MFSKKLAIALVTLAIASLLQGGVAWWAIDAAANNVQRGRVASDVLAGFLELSATKQRLRTWLSQALLDAGADAQQRDKLQADMAATLTGLESLELSAAQLDGDRAINHPEHLQRQDALVVLRRSLDELSADMATARALPPGANAVAAWTELTRVFNQSQGQDLRSLLAGSIARERTAVARERAAADRSLALVRGFALGATVTIALAATLLALYFARALRRPLDELSAGAEALQRGDLQHRIPDDRHDEFARFATRVNAMTDELAQHRQREAEARQRLEDLVQVRTAELQKALDTLQQFNARRRQLFADISHELRTPTTAIRGEAEIALRGREKPVDEYKASLLRIVDASTHLGIVIDDLLTMARSDIDALALSRVPLNVGEPLRDAIEQAQALGRERGVRVESPRGETNGVPVLADAQRLRQLFTLLLDNAVRYSHAEGLVQVGARQVADPEAGLQWELCIVDQGIGIDVDELPRLFERNFRGARARLHRADGSGLGLPIAATLARVHGGRIDVDSQPGRGTAVTLRLPILIEAPDLAPSP